jgi:hypothetical protein
MIVIGNSHLLPKDVKVAVKLPLHVESRLRRIAFTWFGFVNVICCLTSRNGHVIVNEVGSEHLTANLYTPSFHGLI